ncbi:MAG: DNA alkylation repair protein [Planctomycetota bacterium]
MPPSKKTGAKKAAKKTAKKSAKKSAAKKSSSAVDRAAREWNLDQVMAELEAAGTEQNRKVYPRHGADPDKLFGVSFANYYKIAKDIRPGTGAAHKIAFELWETENHDARVLACMIADPGKMEAADLDRWAGQAGNYIVADAVATLTARTPIAESRVRRWARARDEYTLRCAYTVLANLLKQEAEGEGKSKASRSASRDIPKLDAEELAEHLKTIEDEIHDAFNRTREAMNTCLIALGTYRDDLRDDALAAAGRIGAVDVDHGETGCKTPDAAPYIHKAVEHRKAKKNA